MLPRRYVPRRSILFRRSTTIVRRRSIRRAIPLSVLIVVAISWCEAAAIRAADPAAPAFTLETIRGRVVWTAEAMARLHGATSVADAAHHGLALETREGRLFPLLEDVRGRAFRVDERLRKMEVELLVRRYPNAPPVQVVNVFEIRKEGKFEIDYWCEVCAIAMFELKFCECCQGETELRKRPVADSGRSPTP